MGRIPPVQCEWGHGWNEELIHMLNKFIDYNSKDEHDVASAKRIIDNIEHYGRSNDDGETFYMFEREAANLVYLLLVLNTCQEIKLQVQTKCLDELLDKYAKQERELKTTLELYEKYKALVTQYEETSKTFQETIKIQDATISKYQEALDIVFGKIEKDAPQLLEKTNENSSEMDVLQDEIPEEE